MVKLRNTGLSQTPRICILTLVILSTAMQPIQQLQLNSLKERIFLLATIPRFSWTIFIVSLCRAIASSPYAWIAYWIPAFTGYFNKVIFDTIIHDFYPTWPSSYLSLPSLHRIDNRRIESMSYLCIRFFHLWMDDYLLSSIKPISTSLKFDYCKRLCEIIWK